MEKLEFKLYQFEGPLELLLHLIGKHKLDIYDIEISLLLAQYLDYINKATELNLELASDFLVMAARLVYIKTVSLLPKDLEGEQLKRELEGELLEYHLVKLASVYLKNRYKGGLIFLRQPIKLEVDKTYSLTHNAIVLANAYATATSRATKDVKPTKQEFAGIVSKRMVTVMSRIIYVLRRLYKERMLPYDEFFKGDRSELVATFMAMLELIKSKRIAVSDDNAYVSFVGIKHNDAKTEDS